MHQIFLALLSLSRTLLSRSHSCNVRSPDACNCCCLCRFGVCAAATISCDVLPFLFRFAPFALRLSLCFCFCASARQRAPSPTVWLGRKHRQAASQLALSTLREIAKVVDERWRERERAEWAVVKGEVLVEVGDACVGTFNLMRLRHCIFHALHTTMGREAFPIGFAFVPLV